MALRAVAYIDGFNLYYGAVRGTPYRWLDIAALCRRILPATLPGPSGQDEPVQLIGVKYFTAPIKPKSPTDHGPVHQGIYLDALKEHLGALLTVHEGFYLQTKIHATPVNTAVHGNSVLVHKSEEKGSDVNLAVCLVADGFLGHYDVALVVSNDSDLGMAIDLVKTHTVRQVVVFLPNLFLSKAQLGAGLKPRPSSKVLMAKGDFLVRYVRPGVLGACQLPDPMPSGITKPANW